MDFQTKCYIKSYRLTDDAVEEIKGLPKYSYNPFTHYKGTGERELYLQFVAIDENEPNDVLKFISTYGFLGFKSDKDRQHREELKRIKDNHEKDKEISDNLNKKIEQIYKDLAINALKATVKNPLIAFDVISYLNGDADDSSAPSPVVDETPVDHVEQFRQFLLNLPPESEKLEDIKREIMTMRYLVLLWQEIRAKNRIGVLNQLLNLSEFEFLNIDLADAKEPADDLIFVEATVALSRLINKKLAGVTPMISSTLTDSGCFQGLWQASNLLSSMYVMFYMDLTRGVILRKCQNQPCKEFFSIYGNDERKIYCCESCSSSQKQRDYRRRKKEQKLK